MRSKDRPPDRKGQEKRQGNGAFPVVGIGASAGGLEAFTQLLTHLPLDTGMAFVLVQHLDPRHESALTEILSRATSLPVREITNDLRVQPDHVYVIPPNTDLNIRRGALRLRPRQPAHLPHRSIDTFFESLAADQGERAIGVVLSGTASDGTLGLGAIKAEGGITFAQDDSARHDEMPRSAVAAGCVDLVLPPDEIARELARIAKRPGSRLGTERSRGQLESANKELLTLNEEMSHRNAELIRLYNDLVNLQTSTKLAIVLLGRDLTIRRFSPQAERQFNLVATDVGRPIGQIRHNLVVGGSIPFDIEALAIETIATVREQEREFQDQAGRWYSLRMRPYMTLDDVVDGAVLVLMDINTLKRSEQEIKAKEQLLQQTHAALQAHAEGLRQSERRLTTELAATQQLQSASALLLEGGSDDKLYQELVDAAVAIMHSDMGCMQMVDENKDALRMIASRGFNSEFVEVFGMDGPDSKTSCAVARREGHRVIVSDVETCDFLVGTPALEDHRKTGIRAVQSTPLFSRTGHLVGMISTHWRTPHTPTEGDLRPLDVLARQAADLIERRGIEEATARLAAIVASSDDAIVGKDLDGVITSWNRGAERLFGYAEREIVGKPVTLLLPEDRLDEEPSILERIRRGERVEHYETVRRRKDGSLVEISITVSPIRDTAGRIIGAAKIARDMTAHKAAERALREADRRKNEFLAMLAHELRGPLAPIRNGLQVLRTHGAKSGDIDSATTIMERQLGHMARLIDDLIDVSRISRGKLELRKEPTELTAAVRSVAEATLPACGAMCQVLSVTLPQQPLYVDADPTRLAQVVGNLLNNACKFTDRGGRIELTVDREDAEAVIRVRDNGIGISADYLPRIFDLFTQIDQSMERARGGLGIGLSLVKDVVDMHGGTIVASSAGLGKGSEFVVRLPLITPATPTAPSAAAAARTEATRRILVVDDSHDSAESLAMLLTLKGHDVHTAHDGPAAVEEAAKLHPQIVLLDIGLPGLNGFEVARRIRKQPGGAEVSLVALTGWGQEEYRRRSQEAGFNAHLVKPVAPEDLDRLLETTATGNK